MNNDQQTKNQRIHELLGKCWHDLTTERTDTGFVSHCSKCLTRWNEYAVLEILPDYYNSIEHAREALAFAVEQKGVDMISLFLRTAIARLWCDEALSMSSDDILLAAALAPPPVLCDAFLGVMTEGE